VTSHVDDGAGRGSPQQARQWPHLPEAITQGDDAAEPLSQAADALEEAVAGRISGGEENPAPSSRGLGSTWFRCRR
jgi:hypothetical protein